MLLLVVDDDALSRDLLTLLLEAEGYEVEVSVSGEAAVKRTLACEHEARAVPQVILADLQMPGLAGQALAQALRPLVPTDTLLLAMSGSRPESAAWKGYDGFLLKPFNVSELNSMIFGNGKQTTVTEEPASKNLPEDKFCTAALDEDIYAKMSDLMPLVQLGQMYTLCVTDARKRIATMETLAAGGDDAEYRGQAHAVKGGSGMIGASELYELAAAAEKDGLSVYKLSPGTSSVTERLTQLSLACDRLERILQERTQGIDLP